MSEPLDLKTIHIKDFEPISKEVLEILPKSLICQQFIIPVSKTEGRLIAAVPKAEGIVKPQGLQLVAHCPVDLVLAPMEEIVEFIKHHFSDDTCSYEPESAAPNTQNAPSTSLPAPLTKCLEEAVTNRASEILIEISEGRVKLRQRIRGVLVTDLSSKLSHPEALNTMEFIGKRGESESGNDIHWCDWPFTYSFGEEKYFCHAILSKTKTMGVLTLRLNSSKEKMFSPSTWGMGPLQARILENLLQRNQGVLLFCGTDTDDFLSHLTSCVKELATPERHVIAVEDFQGRWFAGIEQLVSNGNSRLFANLLKLAFKHEPDVVVVNPFDSAESISLCFREALKGRLVLSHCYSRDTAEALAYLLGMGVEPALMGSSLLGIVAQRNIRLNCPQCQEKDPIHRDRVKEMGIPIAMQPTSFYRGKGCRSCLKTGFDRESSIFEVIEMTDELRNRLVPGIKTDDIRDILRSTGTMTLRQIAVHKAVNGQTSLFEVLRVTP